ncbi:unnamed protein product, partial [Linum tenue]
KKIKYNYRTTRPPLSLVSPVSLSICLLPTLLLSKNDDAKGRNNGDGDGKNDGILTATTDRVEETADDEGYFVDDD